MYTQYYTVLMQVTSSKIYINASFRVPKHFFYNQNMLLLTTFPAYTYVVSTSLEQGLIVHAP